MEAVSPMHILLNISKEDMWEYCRKGVWLLVIKQTQIKLIFTLENHKSTNFVTQDLQTFGTKPANERSHMVLKRKK